MSGAPLAAVCIRCGSKEHSTREHDEQKAGKKPAAEKKKPAAAKPAAAAATALTKPSKIQHSMCWNATMKVEGIPDIIDKPLRDRFYQDPPNESWSHRAACTCTICEKKALRRRVETERRSARGKYLI
jgi:hypothetical protein